MLKVMRKNIKSLAPILWIVIATFIIAIFAVWGGGGSIGEKRTSNVIATVGGTKIVTEDFTATLRQRLDNLKTQLKELNRGLIQQLNLPQQVLEEMIQQELLLQMAKDMGLSASNAELSRKIMSYPAFQKDGVFIGAEEYRNILSWNHIQVADFERNLRNEVILSKLVQVLTAGLAVTPEEAWEGYRRANETAKIEYLVLEKDKVKVDGQPGPAEVQAYFEKNKDKFKIPEKREAAYVFLRTDDLKKEVELSEAEIEKYYKDNIDQFKVPEEVAVSRIYLPLEKKAKDLVLAEARSLLDRMAKGEDFGELAKKFSKDTKSAQGGDWGASEWTTLEPKEQDEIKKLGQGKVSGPVEVKDGVSLLKVTKKSEAATTPLTEAKAKIKTMLEEQKAQALAAERIGKLEKDARKEKSLESAAAKSNFKAERTGQLKKGEALGAIDPSGVISNALFALAGKDLSSPLFTYRGVGLAQLAAIAPPREAKLDEVRDEVVQDLAEVRKKEKALEQIQAVRPKINPKQTWDDLAQKNGLEFKTVNEHKRGQYLGTIGENAEVDQLSFSLPLKTASEPVEFANGYLLVQVLERKEVTPADFAKVKDKEINTLLADKSNKFLSSYLIKLREEKGVKVNYNVFLQVQTDILSRFAE
jgi:peptidyl-prolyl cis-trans isomerase D